MRTMPSCSRGVAPLRAPIRFGLGALWLECTVLLVPVSANTRPVLIAAASQLANEGALLDLSGMDGAPPLGFFFDPDAADVHSATVDWGDGTATQMATIIQSPGSGALGGSHHYADDGLHTVTVSVDDNAGGSDSKSFMVTVGNVNPTLSVTPSQTSIYEGQSISFNALFSDPGFDNPLNPTTPLTGERFAESFRYYLSWGDGLGTIATQDVADTNGGPGIASTGAFSGVHTYTNDGGYTVTVRLADDNMGAYADSARFLAGVAGIDYVEQAFNVTVLPIPEPTAIVLTMIGLACLLAQRGRPML